MNLLVFCYSFLNALPLFSKLTLDGEEFIFERIQAKQLPDLEKKKELLEHLISEIPGVRANNALLRPNPPLLVIRDRVNAYALRHKVSGIHWEEAVEQLQSSPRLKGMNTCMEIDRLIFITVRRANEMVVEHLGVDEKRLVNLLTWFVSWDLKNNQPKLTVDFSCTFVESVWIA